MALPDDIRDEIVDLLTRGEDVPLEYQRFLFPPERREYELVYGGKEREADILADTMAVPLQPVRTFGANPDATDWNNLLVFGDNIQIMKTLLSWKKNGKLRNSDGTDGVKLVYIDPPFATKQEFRGNQDQKAYQDKMAGARFLEFIRHRLIMIRELLTSDGQVYVHLNWRKGPYVKCLLDEVFGEHRFANEIIWRATDPHNDVTKKYGAIHQNIYFYKMQDASLNFGEVRDNLSEAALREYKDVLLSDGKTVVKWKPGVEGRRFKLDDATQPAIVEDKRFLWRGKRPGNGRSWMKTHEEMEAGLRTFEYYLRNPEKGTLRCKVSFLDENLGQKPQDIWDSCGNMKGGGTYPTEKPEELLARIIRASSKPGDIVLDAFAGSGTTPAVAEKIGRRWIAIDSGKLSVYTIQKRILGLRSEIGNSGESLPHQPFTLYNAGLYDFAKLKELSWEDWRFFALALFECRDEPHVVNGLKLDGKRRGASVLVFNHHERPGQRVDEEFVQNIHEIVGGRVGDEFCIVAPKAVFDFQQDYLEMDGVRYYALRIPYSFISELHRRSFSALKQPSSEADVNGLVDSYGFDFIVRPTFAFETGIVPHGKGLFTEAYLKITQFKSHSKIKGGETGEGREALSMLMLDFNYDGEVFDFDAVFYAHQLATADWTVRFAEENLGEKMMAVFIDIHGNEAQEVIGREKFAPGIDMIGAETSEKE